MARLRNLVGLVLTASVSFAFTLPAASAATPPKVVLVYGDSLTYEATATIRSRLPAAKFSLVVRATPSIALCDMQAWLETDLATYTPALVVVETHGGHSTPCMDGIPRGSAEYFDRYASDFAEFAAATQAVGARLVLSRTPREQTKAGESEQSRLTSLAAAAGFTVANGPRAALGTKWSMTMKCLATETAAMGCGTDGRILVHAPDGLHFCPTGYADYAAFLAGCSVYSSGALRYGRAVAAAIKVATRTTT